MEVGPYRLVGVIKSFDQKMIQVQSGTTLLELPKNLIPPHQIKSGGAVDVLLLEENKLKIKILSKSK